MIAPFPYFLHFTTQIQKSIMSDFEDYDDIEGSMEADIDTMEFTSDIADNEIDVDAEALDADVDVDFCIDVSFAFDLSLKRQVQTLSD